MLTELNDEVRRRIAFHEAGHIWMMLHEGLGVLTSTVDRSHTAPGDTRGLTVAKTVMDENSPELSQRFARAALAGSLAEHYLMGQWDEEILQARDFDNEKAKSALAMSGEERPPEALDFTIHSLSNTVLNEISRLKAWHDITLIAYALMEKEMLTGDDIAILLEGN